MFTDSSISDVGAGIDIFKDSSKEGISIKIEENLSIETLAIFMAIFIALFIKISKHKTKQHKFKFE